MSVAGEQLPLEGEVEPLKRLWQTEQEDLERSQRVQSQLRAVLLSLQQRCDELSAENKRRRAEAETSNPLKALSAAVESEIEDLGRNLELVRSRKTALVSDVSEQVRAEAASKAREAQCRSKLDDTSKEEDSLGKLRESAEERHQQMQARARSMVSQEALERTANEVQKLQEQVVMQEAEAARLRQALADSWAARTMEELDFGDDNGGQALPKVQSDTDAARGLGLDDMQQELEWLASVQQEVSAEVWRLQQLERSEASLQAQLLKLSEEKAALQSARVDFEDAGNTLRETIASQSEGYVRRVGNLELARRTADVDRVKLIQECADMQAQLDCMAPELADLSEVEKQHAKLQASHSSLSGEAQRLRAVNSALGAQLLGEEGPVDAEPVSEAMVRALQLQRKLQERSEAQDAEREKLAERIRSLERAAAQPDERPPAAQPSNSRWGGWGAAPAPAAAPKSGALASATSVLRGGLGRLKDGVVEGVLNSI